MLERIVLKNGLRVLFVKKPKSPSTTVLVLVETGSQYETKEINGISHFLEHLVFKGTTKRPRAGMISAELDGLGAQYNAFTSQEYTGYWAKVESSKTATALELVSDLYLNPTFDEEEMNKERGVIIEELNMYEDTPMRKVGDYFNELLYGDQPAGWDIGGTADVIRKVTKQQVIDYRTKHYVPGKTIVVVAGDFSPKKMQKDIERYFGSLKKGPIINQEKTEEHQKSPAVLIKHKESQQSHLVLGVRAFDMYDKRRHELEVLAAILGSGMSSRLFHRVREELGAAYYIRAGADLLKDHGFMAVSAGVDHAKINIVVEAIIEEFKKLKNTLISKEELRKTKDHLIGNFMISLETSDELGSFYGFQEVAHKKILNPEAVIDKINKVTPAGIQALAKELFVSRNLNMAVVGPYKEDDEFKKILTL